jgi:hypothetical protein
MFGGSDPASLGLVPADITVADNYVTKPLSWRTGRWSAKNLIESQERWRVVIARNVFENNWEGRCSGSSSPTCPPTVVTASPNTGHGSGNSATWRTCRA